MAGLTMDLRRGLDMCSVRGKQMAAPIKRNIFLTCTIFYISFKCSYPLDCIASLLRSPSYALQGPNVRAIQCKVVLLSLTCK